MRIFISADIEGATGVVHSDQTTSTSSEYEQGRSFMTGDVNAAIDGAIEAGAEEIVVKDAHGNGRNIFLANLNQKAQLISGWDGERSMVQGIDDTFDALLLIGYHSMASTALGVLAHTYSGVVRRLRLNDEAVGEPELSALIAGHYGVPTVFIAGDQTACEELKGFVGEIPVAVTKIGMGTTSASCLHPRITHEAIKGGVMDALSDVSRFQPFTMDLPMKLTFQATKTTMINSVATMAGVERICSDEVMYVGKNVLDVFHMFRIMLGLAHSLR